MDDFRYSDLAAMTEVFVDESIHDRGDFIAVSVVFTNDGIQDEVDRALTEHGFRPGIDEFKSSARMHGNAAAQGLRAQLHQLLRERCKLGVVRCPVAERNQIAKYTCQLIRAIVERDGGLASATVHFDEGMDASGTHLPKGWIARHNL